ncbi:serine/threonine-protein kinase [Streptomyces olivaceus]|uniref:serine/threonine-protein kinase n=1 Tax=Streptomyces olivaceus TaxID=47716 RepID=UPI001CCE3207|nr:serine/threonine-protein kinase [Streptomyces olivaceus]MBZ6308398.1 protein kinase [Streptomyces olivaceus]MBZ6322358.1 protein kinase [Streptomyces olivaceus]
MHNQDAASPDTGGERLVAGRYRLLSVLGEGGMGTVWRARDEVLHRDVAVKEVRAATELPAARRAQLYTRLEREAWAAARINARGVVTVHDVATFDGRPWIVMEFVRGRSLADVIGAEGALPSAEAARIGAEVLAALRAAHGAGVLHRDVKPANVLLADEGRVVLTDFGIATVEGDTALTLTGEVVGSPEYVAPERALGRTPGAASDLWSLGVLLYAAVQGRSPFRRTTALATLRAIVDDAPPAPHRAGPLAPVIEGLMHKDPGRRMTAEQAERELRLAAGESAPAPETDGVTGTDPVTVTDIGNETETATATALAVPSSATSPATADATVAEEPPTVVNGPPEQPGTTAEPRATTVPTPPPASAPAPAPSFGPPPPGPGFGPVIAPPGPGSEPATAAAPARRNRRTAYLIGAGAAVLVLLGGGLTYALVDKDGGTEGGGKEGDGASASPPVSVTVAGGATAYEGSCPPGEGQAPWFTATFTARSPFQVSYRWVSENGTVVDREWRTLTFREGDPATKKETVRLSTYAREGTLRSAMAVEIREPFDAKSNSVAFSVTCRPAGE